MNPWTRRALVIAVAGSFVLAIALGAAYVAYGSELALAQAADSTADVLTAAGLLWALAVSVAAPDADHPVGHQRAQPIAALVVAVLAGGLAVGVLREAIGALLGSDPVVFGWPLAGFIGLKVGFKTFIAREARRHGADTPSPVLDALGLDARNDVLLGLVSIAGFVAGKYADLPALDAVLALPVAVLIAASAISLAAANVDLLMGRATTDDRHRALADAAAAVDGVLDVADVKAWHHGHELEVWIEIHVDPDATVRAAHDIGEAVERRLLAEDGVATVQVHVDSAG